MKESNNKQSNIAERFFGLESKYNTFNIRPNGVPIWERIRFNLYKNIKQKISNTGQAHTQIPFNKRAYLKGMKLWAKNAIFKNPYFADDRKYLFYGHSRRKFEEDGTWWDIYCDPIYDESAFNYLHIEEPYLMAHKTPAKTENLRYIDFIHYTGAIRRNLGLSDVKITGNDRKRLQEINEAIQQEFNVNVDIVSLAETKLTRRDSILDLYKRFLSRVDPSVAIVVVSYGKHTFLEACHDLDIPTVELQHGTIHDTHLGYSFPTSGQKETFPNYLFTWGEYWNDAAEYPIPDDQVISVGYPYLDQRMKEYNEVKVRDQILFISQGSIGKKLSKFAMEVDQHPEIDHEIVYKLHPGEYDRWCEEYPWLMNADFKIIDSSKPTLYQLFAESRSQVGVYSTAVYEGLCFDLETYIYDCSEATILSSLVETGAAQTISSADELLGLLGREQTNFDSKKYFASNAAENIEKILYELAT